jgi:transcriptional regulator GlxA family with amidase domain
MRAHDPSSLDLQRWAFVLLPQCSMMALGAALDALALANQAGGGAGVAFDLLLASADGRPVGTGSGARVQVDMALADLPRLDAVIVVADLPLPLAGHEPVLELLRRAAEEPRCLLGGIGTGAFLLARAGLLRGHRATVDWPYASLLAEQHPDTIVTGHVFESDRRRLSCAGGHAAFDLVLHHLGETLGPERATAVAAAAGVERPRGPNEPQRRNVAARLGGGQPKLSEAVALMEANLAEPLATEEIARLVGVSRRQLERLFKQHLDSLPSRYYLDMRLARARRLLLQTSGSVLQIGLACGFSSGPHFSNAYRAHFGLTPREQRSARLAAAQGDPRD